MSKLRKCSAVGGFVEVSDKEEGISAKKNSEVYSLMELIISISTNSIFLPFCAAAAAAASVVPSFPVSVTAAFALVLLT